jgi:acyl-homoserine lactone acylase PvdQ
VLRVLKVAAVAGLAGALASSAAGARHDYAAVALNVLPPGESGSFTPDRHSTDQLRLYDGLTPLLGSVSARDLRRYFKPERFGLAGGRARRVEQPLRGLRILRDRWDVPHVYGRTRAKLEFGAGWVTAEDRGLLINLLRGPGRIAALDVPGLDAFSLVGSGSVFEPSVQTEQLVARQLALAEASGPKGRQLVRYVVSFVRGINAYQRAHDTGARAWTPNDVVAVAALLGAVFGKGGGDEIRRAEFLSALANRLGSSNAVDVFSDLAQRNDPDAPVTITKHFPYETEFAPGFVPVDDGSFEPAGPGSSSPAPPAHMSNAILVGAQRSATHHPLFVAGPQVGYAYPELLMEEDLHGGGIDARGVAFPGISFYVLLGRGKDFAWSATSAESDVVDDFTEELCGDDVHYLFHGECRAMDTFDAGTLRGPPGVPDRRLVFRTTVHGPVIGYATIYGRRVAVSQQRSTRGRELLSGIPFQDLNTNRVHSARTFLRAMSRMELTFNWFYADNRDIAMFSSGRLPIRAPGVALGLPTPGTGDWEWRGFLPAARHPQVIDPEDGLIVNWNNKPALDFGAADDNFTYGPVQRVQLLEAGVTPYSPLTLPRVVSAMNLAATQDLRAQHLVPLLAEVMHRVPAPNARDEVLLDLLTAWTIAGSSRLDRDLDGTIDAPGAAILDAAWPGFADAVLAPRLGPLVDRLAQLIPRDDPANPGGSSYFSGWWGYMYKDLEQQLGRPVAQPFSRPYCGDGDLDACARSLWAALDAAGNELAAVQGPDPDAWRADATGERIHFAGFLPDTMRWTNRPTFQQVVSFSGHRPR